MANHQSAEKRIRRNARNTVINGARRSLIRGSLRKVEDAITSGDQQAARAALQAAQPELHRGVNKGVLHKNTVSRKISRLNTRIKAL